MDIIRNQDLVLKVSTHIDPDVWDEGKYYAFVDQLCGQREYQKEAIFTALRFLAGGKYPNLRTLAEENYNENQKLQEAYGSWMVMDNKLQFPELLACSLDLATGTGKSYVLYGIAVIMLAEGLVDRVLTLCPSNTIERGLTEKFNSLARNKDLISAMPPPDDVRYISPSIINASETIIEGSICIENYHAVLEHVNSSIRNSLIGKGERTLVLNDEAHHVDSENPANQRKWKEFLTDEQFSFKRILGVSGTCFLKNNQYFVDVVNRYSLRQAIEERIVKDVEYVTDDSSVNQRRDPDQKRQLIYERHNNAFEEFKQRNIGIRPLTIVVTKSISSCDDIAKELIEFLTTVEDISEEQANEKVIVVTSSRKHESNIACLKTVDNPESKVEWIISVSMLTEGWDVKNVFQIVPHEERAFNSKLLIAQVLGRGLRIPDIWRSPKHPVVTVFNHHAWAGSIENLVNEILEIDKRISCVVIPDSQFHFELHHLNYEKDQSSKETQKIDKINLFEKEYIELPTLLPEERVQIQFDSIGGKPREETLTIKHKTFTTSEIVSYMHTALQAVDDETNKLSDSEKRTQYTKDYPKVWLSEVVKNSISRVGINENKIPEEARQKILAALGTLQRKVSRRVSYDISAKEIVLINTEQRQKDSCSAAEFKYDKAIFYRSDCNNYLPGEQKIFYDELMDLDNEEFSGRAFLACDNDYYFKTPLNLVIADSNPERRFIRALCDEKNAKTVDCWIKNTATGFYSVEYAWSKMTTRKKGASHIKHGMFSPDFFIKQDNRIFVVEIKDNSEVGEPSLENIKKHEFASAHFNRLNEWLKAAKDDSIYQFNMLTPQDYETFFTKLREKALHQFHSHLDFAILTDT